MTTQDPNAANEPGSRAEGEVLDIRDVLAAVPFDRADAGSLGACVVFETIGDSTVVSVDADGNGPAVTLPVATLAGVTGVTLQQLLSANLEVA